MHPKVGIDLQTLTYGFQNEIMTIGDKIGAQVTIRFDV